jgi:hypothetical protein
MIEQILQNHEDRAALIHNGADNVWDLHPTIMKPL